MTEGNNYKSPWGKTPDNNNPNPREKITPIFSKNFDNFKFDPSNTRFILFLLLGLFVVWILSGLYIVDQGEQAAVTRFGKFVRISSAGANYHIPYPVERVTKVKVDRVQREEIGFRSALESTGFRMPTRSKVARFLPEESLMLTGDENIADINFFVQWRVDNIEDYLYNVANVKATVKSAAESAMREIIGNTTIAEALTHGKAKIQEDAKHLLQTTLNEYKSGVMVENLSLLKVEAPSEVIDSFRDVQTARADRNNKINKAESFRNDIIPKARGEAAQIIQKAQGYKVKVIEEAKGGAEKFKSVYAQYSKAKDVTRKRMYLETMESILEGAEKVVMSKDMNSSMVPYLPLKQLRNGNAK
jgi:modulator of FtsH protease HflK